MHTLLVVAAGFGLLGICLFVALTLGGPTPASRALGAKVFLPLWLAGSLVNLWVGIYRAGYSLQEEAPVFLVVFGLPAALALWLWRRAPR